MYVCPNDFSIFYQEVLHFSVKSLIRVQIKHLCFFLLKHLWGCKLKHFNLLHLHLKYFITKIYLQHLFSDKNLQAAEHFEAYYKLSKEHKDEWLIQTEEGLCLSFFADACINLCRIYTTISDRLGSEDMEKSLGYLVMAFDKAKESE